MGSALYFRSPARAARVAQALHQAGHHLLWDPQHCPATIMCAAPQSVCHEIIERSPGDITEWDTLSRIDT